MDHLSFIATSPSSSFEELDVVKGERDAIIARIGPEVDHEVEGCRPATEKRGVEDQIAGVVARGGGGERAGELDGRRPVRAVLHPDAEAPAAIVGAGDLALVDNAIR